MKSLSALSGARFSRLILNLATFSLFFLVLSFLNVPPVQAVDEDCKTTNKTIDATSSYSVEVCLDAPAAGTKTGNVTVTGRLASFTPTPSSGTTSPSWNRIEFFLVPPETNHPSVDDGVELMANGIFLNGSFREAGVTSYSFTFDTDHYADVTDWEIWAVATVRLGGADGHKGDYFFSDPAHHTVTLDNDNTSAPVNTSTFTPVIPTPTGNMVVAVTGDGGASDGHGTEVGNLMEGWNADMALFLGDVYWSGTHEEYENWYHPQFGALKSITNPVIGNHEYQATGPIGKNGEGYFWYWNNVPNYYSYDAGGWHFIHLNTNTSRVLNVTGGSSATYDNSGPGGVGRMTDSSKNWRTNQFVNQTISVGAQRIYIVSNTANQLVLKDPWSSVPSSATSYTINGNTPMQEYWLEDDLAANANKCIIALAHHPRFTIGGHAVDATDAKLGWAWRKLIDAKATAFLVGHDHSYQRWDPIGSAHEGEDSMHETETAGGVTQFVIGTGGHGGTATETTDSRVATSWAGTPTNTNAGAMKFALNKNTIAFQMYKLSNTSTPDDSGSLSCKGSGSINGRVTNSVGGAGISGVNVAYSGSYSDQVAPSAVTGSVTTDADGYYTISNKPALNYTLTLTKSGFDNEVVSNVAVGGATTTTQNATMDSNIGTLSGTVTDPATNAAVSGVTVSIPGGTSVTTDSNGEYSIPALLARTYMLDATKSGYAYVREEATVTVGNTTTVNFSLPQRIFEDDFETGDTSKWTTNNNMTVQTTTVNSTSKAVEGNTTSLAMNLRKTLASTYSELYMRTYFNMKSRGSGFGVGLLQPRTSTNGAIMKVYIETDGRLCVRNEVAGANTCSSITPTENAWHLVELQTIINGTSSTHKVWYDGTEVTALTSTSANLGTTNIGAFNLGEINSGRTFDIVFDDVAVSNAPIGPEYATIIGTLTDNLSDFPVNGVTVSIGSFNTTTANQGGFALVNVPFGTYASSYAKTGYVTHNFNQLVNVKQKSQPIELGYALAPTTGQIEGTVNDAKDDSDVGSVTISYDATHSLTTDPNGYYSFFGVEPGTYTLTASKNGYVTKQKVITVTANNNANGNFTIAKNIFSDDFETGDTSKWTANNNMTVQQSTVHFGDDAVEGNTSTVAMNLRKTLSTTYPELYYRAHFNLKSQSTASNNSVGLLSFRNASDGGIVKVYINSTDGKLCVKNEITSAVPCSTIVPEQNKWHSIELRTIANGTSSTYQIWLNGTEVTALTTTSADFGTNTSIGRIHLGEVNANRTYDVVFDDVQVSDVKIGQAGGSITGTITDSQSSAVLSGVSVTTTGESETTNSSGVYTLSDMPPGTYTVSASKTGYTTQESTQTVLADTATTKNYALVGANIGSITGTITDAGTSSPIEGVTVSYSGGNTTTNSSGVYTLSGVVAGTYTVTASKTGYTTKDASVNVTAGQATSQNYALPLLIHSDDFESGNTNSWTTNNNMTVQQTTVHAGSNAVEGDTTSLAMNLRKTFSGTYGTLFARTYFNIKSQGSSSGIGLLQPRTSTDGGVMKVYIETNGKLCIRNEVALANTCSTITPTQNAWHSVELQATINGSSSTHKVWYDGTEVSELTSTTADLGTANIGRMNLGEVNSGRTFDIVFDDVVVQNAAVGQ